MHRHHASFINPQTGRRETVWFYTKRARRQYMIDRQQELGPLAIEEWESAAPAEAPPRNQTDQPTQKDLL